MRLGFDLRIMRYPPGGTAGYARIALDRMATVRPAGWEVVGLDGWPRLDHDAALPPVVRRAVNVALDMGWLGWGAPLETARHRLDAWFTPASILPAALPRPQVTVMYNLAFLIGWPCREGPDEAPGYAADLRCAALTADPTRAVEPWLATRAGELLGTGSGDGCGATPASISGIAFAPADWPEPFADAVFFADFSRGCVYRAAARDGRPGVGAVEPFWIGAGSVVDLTRGPDGTLYAAGFGEGRISRIVMRDD